ncbi:MAG TPA: hypothetical protein EYM39_09850 [Candidatus Latescibacteria bacterium]|jgi:hypothetical protein|nr:hypothetical protein [Gemmatimonadota bacterium]HIM56994.1 hypothetical protein [Candidatus Latescibacterota bacterium]
MTTYPALHQALTTLVQTIEAGTGHSDGQKIPEQLQRIDELGQQLAPTAPAMLRHYLEKRSYTKAIDLLEGRDETAAPNC